MCFILVPFDPKEVFGKVRAPVKVTLNGYTYRSTIFSMRGMIGIPLRESNRQAAGLQGNATVEVTLELDTDPREVTPPDDLVAAFRAVPGAWEAWQTLSYTHQREHVEAIESAKAAATRTRRIEAALRMVTERAEKARK